MSILDRTLSPLLLLFGALSVVGCDSSSDFEDCVDAVDPSASPGARRLACPASIFNAEELRSREVVGYVRRGEDVVPGAIVRVDPSSRFPASGAIPATTVADSVGYFRLRPVSLRYDLSAKLGEDLLFYTGVAGRYMEPAIEGSQTLARSFTGKVGLRVDRAIPEGRSLAFFVTGDNVVSVSGDLASGLSVMQRQYSSRASIHVIEYETSGGLETATAYGKADVMLDAAVAVLVDVKLEPITVFAEPKFAVSAPPGFAPNAVDIRVGFTRTSDAFLASVPVGTSRKLPLIPNAGYTYRVRVTSDGAVSDTGENGFDVFLPVTPIELPEPPTASAPLDGEARGVGDPLLVDGEGVFEHVLVPEGGGREIRIITRERDVPLPDFGVLGAVPATGPHTWTVRSYPKARYVEDLSGVDSRRYRAMSVAAPRSIILR